MSVRKMSDEAVKSSGTMLVIGTGRWTYTVGYITPGWRAPLLSPLRTKGKRKVI